MIQLEKKSVVPVFEQVAKFIKKDFLYKEDVKRPIQILPEPNLAQRYDVSRNTIRKALTTLSDEGLIARRKGKGTFAKSKVVPPPSKSTDIMCLGVDLFIRDGEHYSPYTSEMLEGIVGQCHKKRINLVLPVFTNEIMNVRDATDLGIKGMICCSSARSELNVTQFKESGLPFIIVNRIADDEEINYVEVDHFEGGYLATKHLIDLGHKKICYIYKEGTTTYKPFKDRFAGYKLALQKNDLVLDDELVVSVNSKILSLPNIATAVFASTDLLAVESIRAIGKAHMRVPEDISIVGFDDLRLPSMPGLQLTTIRQKLSELGSLAVEKLLSMIQGTHTGFVQEKLDVELVIRKSTGQNSSVAGVKN